MFDCITIGDTTLDVFLELEEATVIASAENEGNFKLCLNLGEKLPLKSYHEDIGGNASNVAFGLDRGQLNTAVWTWFGNDSKSAIIKDKLLKTDISTRFISQHGQTNVSTILNFNGERTILHHHNTHDYPITTLAPTKWIYISSMGAGSEELFEEVLKFSNLYNNRLIFNPGSYQIRHQIDFLRTKLAVFDLLFVNKEEAQKISNLLEEEHEPILLQALLDLGLKNVIITDGKQGAFFGNSNKMIHIDALKVQCIEATGAGDAFASGFIIGYISGQSIETCMQYGLLNSASVIGYIGSTKGLLTKQQLELASQNQNFGISSLK